MTRTRLIIFLLAASTAALLIWWLQRTEPPATALAAPPAPVSVESRPRPEPTRVASRPASRKQDPEAPATAASTRLRGVVTSRESSAAVPGCRLKLTDAGLGAVVLERVASDDGRFELELGAEQVAGLSRLALVAVHPSYRVFVSTLPDVPLAADGSLDVRLEARLSVSGSARRIDGSPVSSATVRLSRLLSASPAAPDAPAAMLDLEAPPRELVVRTDDDGLFAIRGVAPGDYKLDVTARGMLRQHARDGVMDTFTRIRVPPSKSNLNFVLEPFDYVACRPIDAKTREPIRIAHMAMVSGHVREVTSDRDLLKDVFGPEKAAWLQDQGVVVGIVTASTRTDRINLGLEAAGYRDAKVDLSSSPLPRLEEWPAEPKVLDAPMEPDPDRIEVEVPVALSGPPWVREVQVVELIFYQRSSPMNPTPTALFRRFRVPLKDGQGTIKTLPGVYDVHPYGGGIRVSPALSFEVRVGSANRLSLVAEDGKVPLRVRGVSPAGAHMPLLYADVHEAGKPDNTPDLVRGTPDVDDPTVIMFLAPPNKAFNLEVVPAGAPVGPGMIRVAPMRSGLEAFQDVDVPLTWAFP